jgi:hypothetical protein
MDHATSHGEELPQPLLEAIHKLVRAGASPEAISSGLGLKLEEVQQVLAKDFSQDAKLAESIREKLKNSRLMTSPVMAPGNSIEQSHLEHILPYQVNTSCFAQRRRPRSQRFA